MSKSISASSMTLHGASCEQNRGTRWGSAGGRGTQITRSEQKSRSHSSLLMSPLPAEGWLWLSTYLSCRTSAEPLFVGPILCLSRYLYLSESKHLSCISCLARHGDFSSNLRNTHIWQGGLNVAPSYPFPITPREDRGKSN